MKYLSLPWFSLVVRKFARPARRLAFLSGLLLCAALPEFAGTLAPTVSSISFGTIPFGTTETILLTIANVGIAKTSTFTTQINGPSYRVLYNAQNTCGAGVAEGQTCTLPIEFAPFSIGAHRDLLYITPTAHSLNESVVDLSGVAPGIGVATEAETTAQFWTIPFGSTSVHPVTITNYGVPGTVTVGSSINGLSFKVLTTSQNTCGAGIAPGQSCVIPVEFAPVTIGPHHDFLTLTPSSGAGSSIGLVGTANGVGNGMEEPLVFPTIPFGTSISLPLPITNVGYPSATIQSSINGPSYKVVTAPESQCSIGVQYYGCTL